MQALYATPIPASTVPGHPVSVIRFLGKLSRVSLHHHALGIVDVSIEPRSEDGLQTIVYIVFPTAVDAASYWKQQPRQFGETSRAAIGGFPQPAVIVTTNLHPPPAPPGIHPPAVGVTLLFLYKNVAIQAGSSSSIRRQSGNQPTALALGKFALEHLKAVQRH